MNNWKIWTAFLVVFLAGAVVGVTGVGMVMKRHFESGKDPKQFHAAIQERVIDRVQRELGLDDRQMVPVKVEIEKTLARLEKLHGETRPKIKAILAEGAERAKQHLTPEQQKKFEEVIMKRGRPKFSIFRLPPPPPPPPFP